MTVKIYVNGDFIGVETFTHEEIKALNECEEIRLVTIK